MIFRGYLSACPAYRSSLGSGGRRGYQQCRVPEMLSSHAHGKSRKAHREINGHSQTCGYIYSCKWFFISSYYNRRLWTMQVNIWETVNSHCGYRYEDMKHTTWARIPGSGLKEGINFTTTYNVRHVNNYHDPSYLHIYSFLFIPLSSFLPFNLLFVFPSFLKPLILYSLG